MTKRKRLFLNISFFTIIVLTLVYFFYEYFYYKNELAATREMYGDGYYIVELVMVMVPISFVMLASIETSIYFNLRYFIIDENKTTIKTVFNILMLMFSVSLFSISFILENIEISIFLIFMLLLLVLRILYIFIRIK